MNHDFVFSVSKKASFANATRRSGHCICNASTSLLERVLHLVPNHQTEMTAFISHNVDLHNTYAYYTVQLTTESDTCCCKAKIDSL